MTKLETLQLKLTATRVRMGVIEATHGAGCGHPGGSLSAADAFTYLYFREMRIDPEQPQDPNRDRFVLSKGHCAPGLYATLAERGFFPVADLPTLRHSNSYLQGHPNMNTVPGVDMSTGSLGQGVSAACGMALAAKQSGSDINVYTLLGDGEIEEGECWEAFMFANHYKLDNLCIMIDVNGLQIDGATRDVMNSEPLDRKMDAFGFNTIVCNGNSFSDLEQAFKMFDLSHGSGKPTCFLLRTTKGLGVSYMENAVDWHGKLAQQGADNLVVFDADLAAATKTDIFKKAYPDRHFDCGIAEQNMVGVAAGMSTMGYVPFVSSFAMFAAGRAFEQIRNSIGYPHLNVKIGATHAGLSVGEDGASHQCCEDIALMRSIPGMVVLSPADDVEARAAVIAAYNYQGPVYLRFSRLATPVFHDPETYEFQIGKGEKLTDGYDIAVIATGLMTNEALRAAVLAKRQGLNVRVINMPTIKPIDEEIILTAARECGRIITVEEHSVIGGLGEAVCAVVSEKLPCLVHRIGVQDQFGHSGPANEVLRDYGLTAENIVSVIREIVRPENK